MQTTLQRGKVDTTTKKLLQHREEDELSLSASYAAEAGTVVYMS